MAILILSRTRPMPNMLALWIGMSTFAVGAALRTEVSALGSIGFFAICPGFSLFVTLLPFPGGMGGVTARPREIMCDKLWLRATQ